MIRQTILFVLILGVFVMSSEAQVCTDTITLRCPSSDPACASCPAGSPCEVSTSPLTTAKWNQAARDIALLCNDTDTHQADPDAHHSLIDPFVIAIENPTTSHSALIQMSWPYAVTASRVRCSTDTGTVTVQFDERVSTTPNVAGTDVLTTALVCDSDTESSSSFSNDGIALDSWMSLDIDAVASSPTKVRIVVEVSQ